MMDLTFRLSVRPNGRLSPSSYKRWLGLSIVALIAFLLITLAVVSKTAMVTVDQDVANSLNDSATSGTTSVFKAITLIGGYGIYGLGLGLAAFFALRHDWRRFVVWSGAIGGGQVINILLKTLIARSRPVLAHPVMVDKGYSFPSGHSMMSMVAYGLLAYFLYRAFQHRWQQIPIVALTALFISLVGLSRLVLGVHFTSDVLAGFAMGMVWLSLSIIALQILEQVTVERMIHLSVHRAAVVE